LKQKVHCSFVVSLLFYGKFDGFCFPILILNEVFCSRLTIMTVEYGFMMFLIQIPI